MKNRFLVIISSVALIASAASACSSTSSSIKTFKKNSQLVYTSFNGKDDSSSCTLPTYHHSKFGDVPYVELSEFTYALQTINSQLMSKFAKVEKISKDLYSISAYGIPAMYFNPATDTVTVLREEILTLDVSILNNGVGPDMATPNDSANSCVHTSSLSKYVIPPTSQVYELRKYNIDLVEQNNKLYLPEPFAAAMLFKNTPIDIFYNGLDYYFSVTIGEGKELLLGANCSYYSNYKEFSLMGTTFKEYPKVGDEVYRYAAQLETGEYSIFSFNQDGTITRYKVATPDAKGETPLSADMEMIYTVGDDGIYVSSLVPFMDEKTNLGTFKIPFEKTNFNTKTRSKAMAKYSYDHLRFIFDNLYGLPEELHEKQGVKNIDELIEKNNLKAGLLDTNSINYDEALATLTMTYIDDCHTKYVEPSIYSGFEHKGADLAVKHYGPRRANMANIIAEYKALRTSEMTKIDPKYSDEKLQVGLFMEGSTAVVRFDGFNSQASLIDRSATFDTSVENIPALMQTSSPNGFYASFKEIDNHDEIKNVVIDLTCNGGGAVLALPYLAAYFTDDPTFILRNSKTGSIAEFHYSVDLNRNGVFGEADDTYKNKYNIFLLTSNYSFSCGNAYPTLARTAGTKIIGQQSGGGACAVKPFSDGCGSLFNTSNQNQIIYKDPNGNYINNDAGIPVDYELDSSSWYDLAKLNTFVNGLVNNN